MTEHRPDDAAVPDPSFVAALRRELLAAAEREVRHRRRRRVAAAAAVVGSLAVLGTALALLAPRPSPAAAEVLVEVRDGDVEITLVGVEHRPERIEAAARRAGLDVQVRAVPVGPSLVGRFVGDETAGPLPPELEPLEGDGSRGFRGFSLPAGWSGTLRLLVGSPAAPGERYARFTDATAPGEALACRSVVGRTAAAVAEDLPGGVDVRFSVTQGTRTRFVPPHRLAAEGRADWVVAAAHGTESAAAVLPLVPPATPVPTPPPDPECP